MAMQDSDVIAKLKRIIDEYGISTFSYHAKANALVSDYFPGGENERTRRLIKALIDCDAFIKISKANSGNIDGVCKSIKYVLVDVESLSEERAEIAIGWVCGSMGKRAPKFPQANPAKSNNQSTTSNSNNYGTSSSRPIQPTPQNTNNNMGVNQYGQYGIDPNYVVKRKRVRPNVPKPLIISVIAFVVAIVGGFSVFTLINNNKIDTVENLISALPDGENYYLDYQAEIVDAYAAYMELDEKLQGKVENADKLMSVMDGLKVAEAYEQRQNMQFTKLDGGGYSVKLKEGANSKISGELVIPGVYRQEPVVTIEDYAFENCRGITAVVVPDSITTIGTGAFKGCSNIKSMTLPFTGKSNDATAYEAVFGYIFGYTTQQQEESSNPNKDFVNEPYGEVEGAICQYTIHNRTNTLYEWSRQSFFYYVPTSIREVTITNQMDIKDAAYNGCKYIEKITYIQTIDYFGTAAFQNCTSLLYFNSENKGEANLSGNANKIADYLLRNCSRINIIKISNAASIIGEYAFENISVTEVVVPNSVTDIKQGAFYSCDKLSKITLPFIGKNLDSIAYEAVFGYIFGYITQQQEESSNPNKDFVNEPYGEVEGAICQYTIHNRTNTLYEWSRQSFFYYVPTSLTTVIITRQENIPVAAFNGCTMLETITFEQGIDSQGEAAFQNCSATVNKGN